jgi:hypothetical protein
VLLERGSCARFTGHEPVPFCMKQGTQWGGLWRTT